MTKATVALDGGPIERKILLLRGQRVMLDADIAGLYGVTTRHLNQQVRRQHGRFPEDFMFAIGGGEGAGDHKV